MVLADSQMALALRQITAHEAAVGFLNTVVQGQDLLAEGDGGGILALLAIVFAQSIGNIQIRLFSVALFAGATNRRRDPLPRKSP